MPASELPHALQGSIVGLLAERADAALAAVDCTLPAACLGLGLIRTLDTERGLLYLLTPLPLDQLRRVNTLQVRVVDASLWCPISMSACPRSNLHRRASAAQVGRLELPQALLQSPGTQSPYLAPFSLSAEGSGSKIMKSRGNLARVGQAA